MAYADRHFWCYEFDGSSTGDKAYFGGFSKPVVIHRISAILLDATTGAGTINFDKRVGSTDTANGVGTLTVSASQVAGDTLYETASTPVQIPVGTYCVVAVDDAFDALALVGIEYSVLEAAMGDTVAVAA